MFHTHLCLTLKTNTIGFKEVIAPTVKKTKSSSSLDENKLGENVNKQLKQTQGQVNRSASDFQSDFAKSKQQQKQKNQLEIPGSRSSLAEQQVWLR